MLLMPSLGPTLLLPAALNPDAPLNRDLVDWWLPLPERAGGLTLHSLASARHGTLANMTPSTASIGWAPSARPGGGLETRYDGASTYVTMGVSSAHDFANQSFTLLLWCRATAAGYLVARRRGVSTGICGGYFLRLDSGGTFTARVVDENNTAAASRSTVGTGYLDGVWRHVAVVFTTNTTTLASNDVTIYVNGLQEQGARTDNGANGYAIPDQPLVLGTVSDLAAGNFVTGALGDVRLIRRGLTAAEIAQQYLAARLGYPQELAWSDPVVGVSTLPLLQTPALVAATQASNSDTRNVTTAGITTTGATLLVVAVSSWALSTVGTVSDSKGNTWTPLTAQPVASDARAQLFYATNPVVGTSHTFTYTGPPSGNAAYCALGVGAWSGVRTVTPFDGESGAVNPGGTVTSQTAGTLTPSRSGDLVVTALGQGATGTGTAAVSGGFSVAAGLPSASNILGVSLAWQVNATTLPTTPTWTVGVATNLSAVQAAFIAAPLAQSRTSTGQASASTAPVASNVRASTGQTSDVLSRLASNVRTSPGQAQDTLTRVASQVTTRTGIAQETMSRLASNVRASTGQGSDTTTRIAHAPRTSAGQTQASSTQVGSGQQTLSLQATALALTQVGAQARLSLGQASALTTRVAHAQTTRAGSGAALVSLVRSQVRTSPGHASDALSLVGSAHQVLDALQADTVAVLASNVRALLGQTHGLSTRQVMLQLLTRQGHATAVGATGASQQKALDAQALATLQTQVSATLVAQGATSAQAAAQTHAAVARVLMAQAQVLLANQATLTLTGQAQALSGQVAHAQRTLQAQAQALSTRLVSNVRHLSGQTRAHAQASEVVSQDDVRRCIATARVHVEGRFYVGQELHIVGPGNRPLRTYYGRAPLRIYRYPWRRR